MVSKTAILTQYCALNGKQKAVITAISFKKNEHWVPEVDDLVNTLNWHSSWEWGVKFITKRCFRCMVLYPSSHVIKINLPRKVRCMNAKASQNCSQVQL